MNSVSIETPKTLDDDPYAPVEIDLKNRWLAALWAWLWPGAGHIYQGRYGKGLLFMVCILIIYFWGLALGGGHVVYATSPAKLATSIPRMVLSRKARRTGREFRRPDEHVRYPYICQIGVGMPALPALVQYSRISSGKEPLFGLDVMAPPDAPVLESEYDELAQWHADYGFYFELGTLYTMVAGLLNILAIYDAHSGPVFTAPDKKREKDSSDSDDESEAAEGG